VKSISQRELRNDNAAVIREVEQGVVFTVTRRGVPVARLGPLGDQSELRCIRHATKRLDPSTIRRVTSTQRTADVLDDLRGGR